MRVATVSDLHMDFRPNRELFVHLAGAMLKGGADVVVVAGDISHHIEWIERTFASLKAFCEDVLFVPGNHDLWFDVPNAAADDQLDTWNRYTHQLRTVCEGAGVHYLPAAPWIRDGFGVSGTCGWYDYSLMLPKIRATVSEEALAKKRYGKMGWSDARFIAFRDDDGAVMPDPAVSARMTEAFRAQLAELEADAGVRDVLAVTHHLPFEEAAHRTGTLPWEYFNAFMGSTALGDTIEAFSKVRWVVYGHTHVLGAFERNGRRVYGTPLGYPRERKGLSLEEVLETRIGWIDC